MTTPGVSSAASRPPAQRGSRRPPRGRGLILTPTDGTYAAVPVCAPDDWLRAVEFALTLPTVEALRRRLRVAGPATVLAAAREWAAAADRRTGRDVAVSHGTVAARIGYAEATVKRIMRFLSRLGFVVECARGRNRLTLEELAEARALGAEHQRAAASTRALTIPHAVDGTPLPLSGSLSETSPVKEYSPTRALPRTREATAPRRPAMTKSSSAVESPRPRPLAVQQLSAQLVRRLPWLDRTGKHIGHLCGLIVRCQLVERGWTVQQLLDRLEQHARATGVRIADATDQRDPLSYLAWLIRRAIPADEVAPRATTAAERNRRLQDAAAQRLAEAARRAELEQQAAEIQSVIDAMHAQFPRRPRPATGR